MADRRKAPGHRPTDMALGLFVFVQRLAAVSAFAVILLLGFSSAQAAKPLVKVSGEGAQCVLQAHQGYLHWGCLVDPDGGFVAELAALAKRRWRFWASTAWGRALGLAVFQPQEEPGQTKSQPRFVGSEPSLKNTLAPPSQVQSAAGLLATHGEVDVQGLYSYWALRSSARDIIAVVEALGLISLQRLRIGPKDGQLFVRAEFTKSPDQGLVGAMVAKNSGPKFPAQGLGSGYLNVDGKRAWVALAQLLGRLMPVRYSMLSAQIDGADAQSGVRLYEDLLAQSRWAWSVQDRRHGCLALYTSAKADARRWWQPVMRAFSHATGQPAQTPQNEGQGAAAVVTLKLAPSVSTWAARTAMGFCTGTSKGSAQVRGQFWPMPMANSQRVNHFGAGVFLGPGAQTITWRLIPEKGNVVTLKLAPLRPLAPPAKGSRR